MMLYPMMMVKCLVKLPLRYLTAFGCLITTVQVHAEVMRTLDKFENQSLPKVDLSEIGVDFGEVLYDCKKTESIAITNTGSVVAHFRLVPKLEEEHLCKDWITVDPEFGMLIPGER